MITLVFGEDFNVVNLEHCPIISCGTSSRQAKDFGTHICNLKISSKLTFAIIYLRIGSAFLLHCVVSNCLYL